MSERTNEVVLKTTVGKPTGGSNPSPSATTEGPGWGGAGVDDRGRLLSG